MKPLGDRIRSGWRSAWAAWVDPIPAVRLDVWRRLLACGLLLDFGLTYLPEGGRLLQATGYLGPTTPTWAPAAWLKQCPGLGPYAGWVALVTGLAAAIAMLANRGPRVAALLAWWAVLTLNDWNRDLLNGGDRLKPLWFLLLAVAPPRRPDGLVAGWPMRLALVQLAVVYVAAGLTKLRDPDWQNGQAMASILVNPQWALAPAVGAVLPSALLKLSTWLTLAWELSFPILALTLRTRLPLLALGALFHGATFWMLDVGLFALWTPLGYIPALPWEAWRARWLGTNRVSTPTPPER